MRIRKNSKLSPLLFSFSSSSQGAASFPVQTHLCQLNQSSWDVIPFHSDSIQFEGDDSFNAGNGGSAGDYVGVVDSVASMGKLADMVMADENQEREKMEIDNINKKGVSKPLCTKGWSYKNEPKHGQSFGRHHLSIVDKKAAETAVTTVAAVSATRRGLRARARKKASSSSSNPYEFYYYSGFGPQWGKRRGSERKERSKNSSAATRDNATMMMESDNIIAATRDDTNC